MCILIISSHHSAVKETKTRVFDPCGGGVEYLHVTLRVVRGDEMGSLESEAVKYGHEFYGTQTQK
jgi:hypothetical protein